MTRVSDMAAAMPERLRALRRQLRIRYWTWRGARIEAREEREAERQRQKFAADLYGSLVGVSTRPATRTFTRKKWSSGR